ncbi:unnamed protein product, partial [Symbiodinium sp. KB8]
MRSVFRRAASSGLLKNMQVVSETSVPGSYAGYGGPRILSPLSVTPSCSPKRAKVAEPRKASSSTQTTLVGRTLADWVVSESAEHQALLVERQPWWKDFQEALDQGVLQGDIREEEEIKIEFKRGGDLADAAEKLLNKVRVRLPEDLRSTIRGDVVDIGNVVTHLCPWSNTLLFKLEVMGESACSRWHRDNYCARAIVTYNSSGTVYAPDDIVNFWELDYCGCNDKIIKDASQVCSVGVGDVFFMKGKKFPHGAKGLVHKSPEIRRHDDGRVV